MNSLQHVRIIRPARQRERSGFSLVEVTLAIAIVSFAFVSLLGMLPVGMTTFREAMDTSVTAQIAQRIFGDLQETDFDSLVAGAVEQTDEFFALPLRVFDEQGNEVDPVDKLRALYFVRVRGSRPGDADPAKHRTSFFTALPSTGARFNPRAVSFLTIQIATNPAGRALAVDPATLLFAPGRAPVQTYSQVLARSGYTAPVP